MRRGRRFRSIKMRESTSGITGLARSEILEEKLTSCRRTSRSGKNRGPLMKKTAMEISLESSPIKLLTIVLFKSTTTKLAPVE